MRRAKEILAQIRKEGSERAGELLQAGFEEGGVEFAEGLGIFVAAALDGWILDLDEL